MTEKFLLATAVYVHPYLRPLEKKKVMLLFWKVVDPPRVGQLVLCCF